jgi:hypothetical protein
VYLEVVLGLLGGLLDLRSDPAPNASPGGEAGVLGADIKGGVEASHDGSLAGCTESEIAGGKRRQR